MRRLSCKSRAGAWKVIQTWITLYGNGRTKPPPDWEIITLRLRVLAVLAGNYDNRRRSTTVNLHGLPGRDSASVCSNPSKSSRGRAGYPDLGV